MVWYTPLQSEDRHPDEETMAACTALMWKMRKTVGNLDMYGLDWPVCDDQSKAGGRMQRLTLMTMLAQGGRDDMRSSEPFVPCEQVCTIL